MISKRILLPLQSFKSATGRVLSVYLDVDQAHAENLNRKFEAAFDSKIKGVFGAFEEEYEERDLADCVSDVRKLLRAYVPRAKDLVIFARSAGSIWMRELNVPVKTEVFWGSTAHVQQFLGARRLRDVWGRAQRPIQEPDFYFQARCARQTRRDQCHERCTSHQDAGTDHPYSQSHFDRKADEHALAHLKRVAELLEHVTKFTHVHGLILAGPTEATSELFRLLPKHLRRIEKIVKDPEFLTKLSIADLIRESGAQGVELLMWIVMRAALASFCSETPVFCASEK